MNDSGDNDSGSTAVLSSSLRKRPLEGSNSVDELSPNLDRLSSGQISDAMEFSPTKCAAGTTAVLDEIELHFQRSLLQAKTKQKLLKEKEEPCEDRLSKIHKRMRHSSSTHKMDDEIDVIASKSGPGVVKTDAPTSLSTETSSTTTTVDRGQAVSEVLHRPAIPPLTRSPSLSETSHALNYQLSAKTNAFKVVPSRIVNPCVLSSDATSPPSFKISVSGTNTPSGTLQVIDLAQHGSADKHLARNGLAATAPTQTKPLSLHNTQISHEVGTNSTGKLPTHEESSNSRIIMRTVASSSPSSTSTTTPTKASPVILLPAAASNVASPVMVQSQPYILVNPTAEISRVNHPTLMGVPNVCASAGGYILLSPNHMVPSSLLQVVSSAGASIPALVPSSPLTFINARTKPSVSSSNSTTKVACSSYVSDDNKKDDINVMPASVEDHFAKALGDQWSKLSSSNSATSSSSIIS